MNTPRTVLKIDKNEPGTEIAAETAAAMAAASIVFRGTDHTYARRLLNKAKSLFKFAKAHKGTLDGECPFYCSYSGYNDEQLWAATWLYMATKQPMYFKYITEEAIAANVAEFNWDLKYSAAQILLAQLFWEGHKEFENFKEHADGYICSNHPDSPYKQFWKMAAASPKMKSMVPDNWNGIQQDIKSMVPDNWNGIQQDITGRVQRKHRL